jgi:hypothetical protein
MLKIEALSLLRALWGSGQESTRLLTHQRRRSRSRTIECEFLSRGPAGKSIEVRGLNEVAAPPLEGSIRRSNMVGFLLSFVLFIGVCGFLDSRLPWPPRPTRGRE